MARVVIVGGGFAGMATAARLAKQRHDVTLVEAQPILGGALGTVSRDGFRWDAGPASTLLPAVIRDLFRKSGRAAEKEIELVSVEPAEQHRFPGTRRTGEAVLDLPGGSRAAQIDAIGSALGRDAAESWSTWVDAYGPVWEVLRREWFERPWDPEHASREAVGLLRARTTLQRSVSKAFRDERLRQLAVNRVVLEGHDPRNVPAWEGVWSYVQRNFGTWTVPGGMGTLASVLTSRLATRGVTVVTSTRVTDIVVSQGRAVAVATDQGPIDADVVVSAVDPRSLPALAGWVERTMPAMPATMCHVGLEIAPAEEQFAGLPHQVVLHGDPLLVIRTNGTAPAGHQAWTLLGRGRLAEGLISAVHRRGLPIRDRVRTQVTLSPRELVEQWGGSPHGVLWQGRRTVADRMGARTPLAGVFQVGAATAPGAGLPAVGLSAANAATLIGPA